MVVLATAATVIASQAVISGAFSVSRQADAARLPPAAHDRHTSDPRDRPGLRPGGQLGAVRRGDRARRRRSSSSHELASAYGIAVTGRSSSTRSCSSRWPADLALAGAGSRRRRRGLPRRRGRLLRRQHAPRSSTAGGCRCSSRGAVFIVLRPGGAGARSSPSARTAEEGPLRDFVAGIDERGRRRCTASRAPRCSCTPPSTPRRWPCGRTSSTTTSSTTAWSSSPSSRSRCPTSPTGERVRIDDLGDRDDGITHVTARSASRTAPPCRGRCAWPGAGARVRRSTSRRDLLPVAHHDPAAPRAPGCAAGASGCSSPSPATPRARSSTSACRPSAPFRWGPRSPLTRAHDFCSSGTSCARSAGA